MELIHDYMLQPELRHALNELTQQVFGFDFENWVTKGYFQGDYIPWSLMDGDKMVCNVSANAMEFMQNGEPRRYIQLGTVMTHPDYRNKGLASSLMHHVLSIYAPAWDGIYLFGDLDALDFYRKQGFSQGMQYIPLLKSEYAHLLGQSPAFRPLQKEEQDAYLETLRHPAVNAALDQTNRFGLQLFYTGDFGNVLYCPELDCYAVWEQEEDGLHLTSLTAGHALSLKEVLPRLPKANALKLGFTPCPQDAPLFDLLPFDGGDDYRLFYMGSNLSSIESEKLLFPALSHA